MPKRLLFFFLTLLISSYVSIQSTTAYAQNTSVVDSILANMSTKEKVAQLFIISLSSNPSKKTIEALTDSLECGALPMSELVKCGYGKPITNWTDPTLVLDNAGK